MPGRDNPAWANVCNYCYLPRCYEEYYNNFTLNYLAKFCPINASRKRNIEPEEAILLTKQAQTLPALRKRISFLELVERAGNA
jgi:hypothetical protein